MSRAKKNRYFGIMPQDKFSIKPKVTDSSFYNIIDTASFYKIISRSNRDYYISRTLDTVKFEKDNTGFKFYKNGKVGLFFDVDFNDVNSLNPLKALMGYYDFKDGKLYMEFLCYNWHSGYFLDKYKSSNIKEDKIYLIWLDYDDQEVYRKQKLSDNFLKYSPDW